MSSLAERHAALVARCTFPAPGSPLVCGVSGGADSMALLVLAVAAGCDVTAVHVDHGLRPESQREAAAVQAVAQGLGASFRSERVELEDGPNLEARARAARHSVLGPDAALGHTADDRAETMIVNLMRGAGPDGLASIRPGLRHPILDLRRIDTEKVCELEGIEPFIDPSNIDPRFVRNRIRHEVLPLLAEIAGRDLVPILDRQAGVFSSIADHLRREASGLDPTDARALRESPDAVARVVLREWLRKGADERHPPDAATVERVMSVVRGESVATEIGGNRRVERTAGRLRIVSAPQG
ncbi:MAG: tRNA lysidine(34) synthetase TilS [Actinomycetes bacterium]